MINILIIVIVIIILVIMYIYTYYSHYTYIYTYMIIYLKFNCSIYCLFRWFYKSPWHPTLFRKNWLQFHLTCHARRAWPSPQDDDPRVPELGMTQKTRGVSSNIAMESHEFSEGIHVNHIKSSNSMGYVSHSYVNLSEGNARIFWRVGELGCYSIVMCCL